MLPESELHLHILGRLARVEGLKKSQKPLWMTNKQAELLRNKARTSLFEDACDLGIGQEAIKVMTKEKCGK
jgi:hypothetical protein